MSYLSGRIDNMPHSILSRVLVTMVQSKRDSAHSKSDWFTEKEIERFRELVEFKMNEKGLSSNFTAVTNDQLQYMFELYDEYLFYGRISAALDNKHSTLALETSITAKVGVMGLCSFNKIHGSVSCNYRLCLPGYRFAKLFSVRENSYLNNGIHCKNRLQCYIITFEHELCHLLHHMFIDGILAKSDKKYTMAHGALFMCLASKLFYHKDYKHNLIKGVDSSKTLTKESTNLHQMVYINDVKRQQSFKCKVLAKNPKRALIECFSLKKGRIDPTVPPITYNSVYTSLLPTDINDEEERFLKSRPTKLESGAVSVGQIIYVPFKGNIRKAVITKRNRTTTFYVIYHQNKNGEITVPIDTKIYAWNVNRLFEANSTDREKAIARELVSKLKHRN